MTGAGPPRGDGTTRWSHAICAAAARVADTLSSPAVNVATQSGASHCKMYGLIDDTVRTCPGYEAGVSEG